MIYIYPTKNRTCLRDQSVGSEHVEKKKTKNIDKMWCNNDETNQHLNDIDNIPTDILLRIFSKSIETNGADHTKKEEQRKKENASKKSRKTTNSWILEEKHRNEKMRIRICEAHCHVVIGPNFLQEERIMTKFYHQSLNIFNKRNPEYFSEQLICSSK